LIHSFVDFTGGIDGPSAWFCDLDDRYAQLSKSSDPLKRLSAVVNFEAFLYRLNKALI